MYSSRRILAAALCVSLLACGGKRGGDLSRDGPGSYALTLMGPPNLVLHPGDTRTLQVLLAQDEVGPVPGAIVHFEFQEGDPGGATIDAKDVQTDSTGVATVYLAAGGSSAGRLAFKLVATAPSFGPDPVAFSFNVIPIRRVLQIVASATTRVSADGASATTTIGASNSVGLRVRELDADTGAPIANDLVSFSLPPAAKGAVSFSGGEGTFTAPTGPSGDALALLLTRSTPSGPWLVTAQPIGGGAAVSFSVTVQSASGAPCAANSQCPTGQVCAGSPPTCQPGDGGACGGSNPCPFGYLCRGGVCAPPSGNLCDASAPDCASSQCCDGSTHTCRDLCPTACAAGQHCQAGATCGSGACVSDVVTPDVTGVWLTRHDYRIEEALPAAVREAALALRLIDQALRGKLTVTSVKWIDDTINAVVAGALEQYLPDWLRQVLQIGDTLFTLLSNLRSEGSMHLGKGVDYRHLSGTEVWTNLVFYYLPLCDGNIGGDPSAPPDCARIDLATADAENPAEPARCKGETLPSIAVQVAPFTAEVTGTSAPYSLQVSTSRQVRLKMGRVILSLVDQIISFTTPYHCIDEVTACTAGAGNCPLLDCNGLGQDLATTGWVSAAAVEAACDAAVALAGRTVTRLLATVWTADADLLDFTGRATISGSADLGACEGGSTTCAAKLGNDGWDRDLNTDALRAGRDGSWSGDFFFKLVHKMPGAWSAARPQ